MPPHPFVLVASVSSKVGRQNARVTIPHSHSSPNLRRGYTLACPTAMPASPDTEPCGEPLSLRHMKDPRKYPSRSRRSKAKRAAARSGRRTQPHPMFGEIPLIRHVWTDGKGREHEYFGYDLSYSPQLPRGAVRGDVHRQHFCPMCHVPRFFYVDDARTCVQCGAEFVFSGEEQKFWYETLKFHFDSVAIRCPA